MNLLSALNEMMTRRAALVTEIAQIDAELAEARSALGVSTPPSSGQDAPDDVPRLLGPRPERPCEKCGRVFVPANGVSGRWCSFACYRPAGLPVDERRDLLHRIVKERGPIFTSGLVEVDQLKSISRATIYNDLGVLRRDGLVEDSDEGWRIARDDSTTEEEPDDDSGTPFRSMTNIHH